MIKAKAVSEAKNFIGLCKKMGNNGIATRLLEELLVYCEEQERTLKIKEGLTLESDNVEWVVNDIGELGVKIGNQLFFLYKGKSLNYEEYGEDVEVDSTKSMWRPVYKREFGETVLVPQDTEHRDRGSFNRDGSYSFGEGWKPIPRRNVTE